MRRFLLCTSQSSCASVSEVSLVQAVNTITDSTPDGGSRLVKAMDQLSGAKNGDHFEAWHGESVIIVLVDADKEQVMFDEKALRADLAKTFGPAGGHVDLFDTIMRRMADMETAGNKLVEKLERVHWVPPELKTPFNVA